MGRYVPAEKLIAEIEKTRREFINKGEQNLHDAEIIRRSVISSCNDFLTLITSLQQEQPQVADASKMERLNVDALRDWSMRFAPDIRDAIEATAYHFWNLAIYSMKEK